MPIRKTTEQPIAKDQCQSAEYAANIALKALEFIAKDPRRLARFVGLTGLARDDVASLAQSGGFQAALLDYLLADETLLLVFASECGVHPKDISPAKVRLAQIARNNAESQRLAHRY